MTTSVPKSSPPVSTGDRFALVMFIVGGALIAAWVTIAAIVRIVELARGVNVPVLIEFVGQNATVPTGESSLPVAIDRGTIIADTLPVMAIIPGILGQLALIVTVVVVVVATILLSRRVLSGQVFGRRSTALVVTAGITGLVGFAAVRFFDNMLVMATVAAVSPDLSNAIITVELFPFMLAAFIIATIATAFSIGDRLQRETEGLV